MMTSKVSQQDLAECDAEPIHLIGSIRPAGCLVAVHRQNLTIHYVSDNIQTLFSQRPSEMLGKPLRSFISDEVASTLLPTIRSVKTGVRVSERYRWNPDGYEKVTLIHLAPNEEIVIIEILLQDDPVSEVTDRLHRTVDLKALGEISDPGILMDSVALKIRNFTEFDRVMVYRFADDGSGYVASEAVRKDLESFLGLHYPASDIPAQARRLFTVNRVRVVEDVNYTVVPLIGHRREPEELDLSGSLLRSVSPIHLRYLSNMGVGASLAISLVRDGQLWGMIACHHYSPKSLPPCMLGFTEMLSQVLSVMTDRVERAHQSEYSTRCIDRVDKAMQKVTADEDGIVSGLRSSLRLIANAINADGIVLICDSTTSEYGDVPSAEQREKIVNWLETQDQSLFVTDRLSQVWPQADDTWESSAGVLAFRWSANSWLIFFRNEIVQSVFWAGDPNKTVLRDTDGRLSPRGSFEAWKEDVRGRSRAWLNVEIDALRPLRRLSAVQQISDATSSIGFNRSDHARSQDPVVIVDLEGTVLDWNYAIEKRLGVSDIAGQQLVSMLPFVPPANLSEILLDASKGEVSVGEYKSSDDRSWFEIVVFPVRTDNVRADRVGVAMRDVSERRILEQHLQHAQKWEALGQLTTGMIHNFNNLLTVILSSTELALNQLEQGHPSRGEIIAAQKAGKSAARIVRDLMSFAADKLAVTSDVNIGLMVREQLEIIRHLIRSDIQLEIDIASADLIAVANQNQLEQVLVNLVTNARDAIDGKGRITVRVFCEYVDEERAAGLGIAPANHVVLAVEDSGGGIDNDVIDRIFDPFFTTKSRDQGTGLGLSSSASIVKSFGGAIRVHSHAHRGSQFMVYLRQSKSSSWTPEKRPLAERTILIVDDQTSVAASLAALLTVTGCKVQTAASGKEALAKIDELGNKIDLLVTDQSMPDIRGIELIMKAREQLPRIPMILMSGAPLDNLANSVSNVRFIHKPFDPTEFLKIVADAIRENDN